METDKEGVTDKVKIKITSKIGLNKIQWKDSKPISQIKNLLKIKNKRK